MFEKLLKIIERPSSPFHTYTVPLIWQDPHASKKILDFHLDPNTDKASRNKLFLDQSINWIINKFSIGEKSSVCDLGCGVGHYASAFAREGARVVGIDFSKSSIDHARKVAAQEGLKINYKLENYLEYEEGEAVFDLVILVYCDYCVLSAKQRKNLLNRIYKILKKGGSLLVDVYSTKKLLKEKEIFNCEYVEEGGFWSVEPHFLFHNVWKYEKEEVLLYKWSILESDSSKDLFNWLQCFSIDTLQKELGCNGFEMVEYFSDITGKIYDENSTEIAFVAKPLKPE